MRIKTGKASHISVLDSPAP